MPPVDSRQQSSQSSTRPRAKSPNRVLAEAEEQWVFTEAELARSPSRQDGMSVDKERELRIKGVNFIRQVGIMLKLPELTLSTGAIFFNRYLIRVTLVDKPGAKALHHYTLGATCLFLATKVEESCRKMKDIVIACCRVAQKNPNLEIDEQSKDFWRWRDTILLNEDVLLETLCFDLTIEAPHKQLFELLKFYRVEHNKQLRNAAWAFVTDSNMTQLCLLCTSRTIAAAALYAGARMCDVRLPDTRDRPWWQEQGVQLREMVKAVNYMCQNYEAPQGKGEGVAAAATPMAGGQSIYVGLFTPLDDEGGLVESGDADDDSPWGRTRLRSVQDIGSPAVGVTPAPLVDGSLTAAGERRRGSGASQVSQKRGADALVVQVDGDERAKRRRTSPNARVNGSARQAGGVSAVKDDASEEGEVEE